MARQLIIAAISARMFARAAHKLGYKIITLDAFADDDTRDVAEQCLLVNLTDEGIDEEDFKRKFKQINMEAGCQFIYGSLFDTRPELLNWVMDRVKIVGNLPKTLQFSRGFDFFAQLDDLGIQYPAVQLNIPEHPSAWLAKRFNSSGGVHVRPAALDFKADYFQRKINGKPVSLLFLADGKSVSVVGFNQQLFAPTADMPYRFTGAVGNLVLPIAVQEEFVRVAGRLTIALGLLGLNSLDAVLQHHDLLILELNPRLSATFQLYPNLLHAHMQACAGEMVSLPNYPASKAACVLYADKEISISTDLDWPDWVADISFAKMHRVIINEGQPICTVFAEAENAVSAYQLLLKRVKRMKRKLFHD